MKRNGKILSFVLALMLALAMLLSASGLEIFIIASSDEYERFGTSAKYLETIGVMKGFDDGELHLEEPILRYQAALFFARATTGVVDDTAWGEGASQSFIDVEQYGPVIDMISAAGIVRGYSSTKYGYNDGIRYQDMCAMLVRALGYETEEMVAAYPMSYVLKVEELELDLKNVKPADYLNRGQTAQMVYDAMVTEISQYNDEKWDALREALNGTPAPNAPANPANTYLAKNFNVSAEVMLTVAATENYKNSAGQSFAEEGYVLMYSSDGQEWAFPIEGTPTEDFAEAELINKQFKFIFGDREPTPAKYESGECEILFCEMIEPDFYENLGALGYIDFDEEEGTLTLGNETVESASVYRYSTDANSVYQVVGTLTDLFELIKQNSYFAIEAYDYNNDGDYDYLVYIPYSFGQFAKRTYSGNSYVLVGKYQETAVYDLTDTTEKTHENKTNFVEFFPDNGRTAVSTLNYRPGDTGVKVGASVGEKSLAIKLSGKDIMTGEFMLYNYNVLTNELYVAENLGKFQIGKITSVKTGAQTVTVDGAVMSVGLPGVMSSAEANGAFIGDNAFDNNYTLARQLLSNYEAGKPNAKYLEYNGKLIYLEPYGDSDIVRGDRYAIIDAELTMEEYVKEDEFAEIFDLPHTDKALILKKLDPATGEYESIMVESLTYISHSGGTTNYSENVKFDKLDSKHLLGVWADNQAYDLLKNTFMYAIKDDDENGLYELYTFGTKKTVGTTDISLFKVLGAPVKTEGDPAAPVQLSFNYNKSNLFVGENDMGVSEERVVTTRNTISVIVAQDGYKVVKGELGTNSATTPNSLALSPNALILEATDESLIIFDPAGHLDMAAENNLYGNDTRSIWCPDGISYEGISYFIFTEDSSYDGTEPKYDEDGEVEKDEDGNRLYVHSYRGLYDLHTGSEVDMDFVTTSITPVTEGVINSIRGVIRYDSESGEVALTTYGDALVLNGDYSYGGFSWLAAKDKISFATIAKEGKEAQQCYYNADSDVVYDSLDSLNVTFIDLDAGADVDADLYSFEDAYVFYNDSDSNRKYYTSITLKDKEYPDGTFGSKRHYYNGASHADVIGNGRITELTAGKTGLIDSRSYYRWNGWANYLIPAVNVDGDAIWKYEGSLRVNVTYYAFINYDEEAKSVDAVVVRVGTIGEVVGADDSIPEVSEVPTDDNYTTQLPTL